MGGCCVAPEKLVKFVVVAEFPLTMGGPPAYGLFIGPVAADPIGACCNTLGGRLRLEAIGIAANV